MTWLLDDRPVRRALVTRLRYLGDVAMATVVLQELRRGDPALDLGFLCEEAYAPLLRGQPDCDRVHALATRRRGADARARAGTTGSAADAPAGAAPAVGARLLPARGAAGTVGELRRHRYELLVDLFFNPRSALLLAAAGGRARIGGARGWRRRLYTHTALPPSPTARPAFRRRAPGGLGDHLSRLAPLRHAESGLAFLDWCEAAATRGPVRPRLWTPPLAPGHALAALVRDRAQAPGSFVLLVPGATWPTKEWPVESWRDLARDLAEAQPRSVVVLSPPGGGSRFAPVVSGLPEGRGGALPPQPLASALQVVGAAALVVCADGGVMHAAVGMGRPTLALFGPTDPAVWFPYEEAGPFAVLATRPDCHPCHRHVCDAFVCLPGLAPATVLAACLDLLARAEGAA